MKFILVVVQAILLVLVLDLEQNHIYFKGISKTTVDITTTADYTSASSELKIAIWSFIGILAFEFLMLLGGVVVMFPSLVFLQVFVHFLGCLFTIWFLLDDW